MNEKFELIEKSIKSEVSWKSIKYSLENNKKINKGFVSNFEKQEGLENDANWLELRKDIKYI